MSAKVDALTQKINNLSITRLAIVAAVTPNCEIYGLQGHIITDCHLLIGNMPDQVNYAQGNPYSNTYNTRWRNHPNFSYQNNNALFSPIPPSTTPTNFQKGDIVTPSAPRKSNLELMMENFIASQTQQNKELMNQNIHTNELVK